MRLFFNLDFSNTYKKQLELELKLCIGIELLKNRYIHILMSRSSRPEVICKKGVLKNLAKFTGKHLKKLYGPFL